MCESPDGRPGLPVPNKFYGFCGRKATFNEQLSSFRVQELCEGRGGHPGLSVPNSPYGLGGGKATFNSNFPGAQTRASAKATSRSRTRLVGPAYSQHIRCSASCRICQRVSVLPSPSVTFNVHRTCLVLGTGEAGGGRV